MQITAMTSYVLRWPEPNDFGHDRMTVLLAVDTDAGIRGWGEAIAMWPEACRAIVAIIADGFAPLLSGRDPGNIQGCWEAMKAQSWWYGEGGIASFALSAVDMALWDIAAKDKRRAARTGSGARRTTACRPAPACMSISRRSRIVRAIAGLFRWRFPLDQARPRQGGLSKAGRDPDYDVALVGELRAAIGDERGIMVDAGNGRNGMWRPQSEPSVEWMSSTSRGSRSPSSVRRRRSQELKARTLPSARRRRA